MNSNIHNLFRIIVIATGLVAILAPVARVLFAAGRMKGRTTGGGSVFRRWPVIVCITVIFLAMGFLLWQPLPLPISITAENILSWIGFIIYLPAIGLYLWGFFKLGRQFGISSVTGADLYSDHRFIKSGPYHFVRHPMYLAVILAAIGAFLFFFTWAMLIFLPMSLLVIVRAHQEEKLMEAEYGEEWHAYKGRVPMWIPWKFRKKDAI
jgi:protein-S-isoprenylcysteine O-methyltransferase Ste14